MLKTKIFNNLIIIIINIVFLTNHSYSNDSEDFPEKTESTDFISPSLGGTTGYITTPYARTGWENSDFAMDFGYHFILNYPDHSHMPHVNIYFLKMVEIGTTYDFQGTDGDDYIIHAKINFYKSGSSAIAIGGNFQHIDLTGANDEKFFGQVYIAASYSGKFFSMPAETTIVFGKTFNEGEQNMDFDFSMGFSLNLFPHLFKNYIHWINDLSNFSYSMDPHGIYHFNRGCYNTGLRIVILNRMERFKFNIDVITTDLFDEGDRSFSISATFGAAFI